jgi:DNA-binding MarR family transcriptional regulator
VADDRQISAVRSFNRNVTQRVGALDDHYLARDRPLGESRVLWEIGEAGCDVRRLRARLGLDSGYVSRLLRSLEAAGLVDVAASERDRRVRTARLTTTGRAELARSMLDPLTGEQRRRLVAAMSEVERLLTAGLIDVVDVDPGHRHARHCLRRYFAELDRRFARGFDPAESRLPDAEEMRPPAGLFLVATLRDEPVGCGGLRFHDDEPTELKRMWVDPGVRGLGVGRRLLRELEHRASTHGDLLRLDSNGALTEAIGLYRSAGYREVPAFNDEPYADHWFEKRLATAERRGTPAPRR